MKLIKNITILALTIFATVSMSMAQASTITTTSAAVNAGDPATIHLDWDNGEATYRSVGTDLSFDSAVLTSFDLTDCPAAGYTTDDGYIAANCTDQGAGVIRAGWARISGTVATGRLGTIVFQTAPGATPGDYTVSFLTVTVDGAAPTEVVGMVTINPPPQPIFNATFTGEDPGDMSGEIGTTIESMFEIDNDSGEVGSVLNYTCTVSGGDVAKFSLTGDTTDFDVAQDGTHGFMTLACNSSELGTFTSTVSCVHNDLPNTPEGGDISCTVNEGPLPQFAGDDSGLSLMDVPEEGDDDATATLTVTNSGDDGTTLIGECAYAGSSEITVTGGSFTVAKGADAVVTATCSGAAEGSYDGTLTCGPTDPQTWVAANSPYAVSCKVGPPGDAVYSSAPPAGSTIDMTPPGTPAIERSDVDDQFLVITNAAPEANDRDLVLINCGFEAQMLPESGVSIASDSAGISASSVTSPLAPDAFTTVTFSCDTSMAGNYVETYSCGYDQDGDGIEDEGSPATYTVKCSVRKPESEVDESPTDGRTITIVAAPGDVGFASVSFDEILDEGADAELLDCSFDDDTYHRIISSTSLVAIPSGGSLRVDLEGTGPEDVESVTTTLRCTYSDGVEGDEQEVDVSWPVEIVVQVVAVPTLSTWSLIMMILTLMGLGGMVIRRKMLH